MTTVVPQACPLFVAVVQGDREPTPYRVIAWRAIASDTFAPIVVQPADYEPAGHTLYDTGWIYGFGSTEDEARENARRAAKEHSS